MADVITGPVTRVTNSGGLPYVFDEITVTFDGSAPNTKDVTFDNTYFPSSVKGQATSTPLVVWIWVMRGKLTGVTATSITPTLANASRRIVTLDASTSGNGNCTSGGYEFRPLFFDVLVGDTLTIGLGPNVDDTGTVTLGIGPVGVAE